MEAAFEQLKKDGLNGVDNLVQWMKNSKVIEESQEAETKARKLFEDAKDKKNVELEKFKQVVSTLAAEQKKNLEDFDKQLTEGISQLKGALAAAATAFQSAMSSK